MRNKIMDFSSVKGKGAIVTGASRGMCLFSIIPCERYGTLYYRRCYSGGWSIGSGTPECIYLEASGNYGIRKTDIYGLIFGGTIFSRS